MQGEDSPPGQSRPHEAGASSSSKLPVRHRAVWIKPSNSAPNGANPKRGQSEGWASSKQTRYQTDGKRNRIQCWASRRCAGRKPQN